MRLIQWVGMVGVLLPGFVVAQNPETDQSPPSSEVSGQAQPALQPTAPAEDATSTDVVQTDTVPPPDEAKGVVDKLNQAVLDAMQRANELGYEGRYQLLAPVIRSAYDFKAISRYVLGDFWKQLSDEQRERFVDKMTEYGIAEYAAQFDGYDGEQFKILSEAPFRNHYRVVKARLEVPKDDDVEFVYILRRTEQGWKIIDVRYNGVSDLALKRGQFNEILTKEGYERLLVKLEEKIADYAKGDGNQEKG